jgi:hypothetical protein
VNGHPGSDVLSDLGTGVGEGGGLEHPAVDGTLG